MKEFLTQDNFYENDDYLIRIYKDLLENAKNEYKEKRR